MFSYIGNMWAQDWQNLYDLVVPFQGINTIDVTPAMKAQVKYLL